MPPVEPDKGALTRAPVLLVDDIESNLMVLETVLHDLPCELAIARSGHEALRQLLKRDFAVMLLDVQMPEMDGYEVARHARSNPATRDVPIIFLTAMHEDEASALKGYGSGAVDFLFKPVNAPILRSKVGIFIDLFLSRRQIATGKAELEFAYQELKQAQAQLVQSAKMASLGELVSGVAHEINNPLGFITAHLQTARRSLAEVGSELSGLSASGSYHWSRAQDRLAEMSLGLTRIADLVVKLRTFSRLDEGELKRVSVRESVDAVLTILGPRLRDRILVEVQHGEPEFLECFPGPLNQAIMNLAANGIEAIEGEGRLKIVTGRVDDGYQISITDSGHGIPDELKERVIEPFFTTKAPGQGTGLGLSITYSIVRNHGGTLNFFDAPGGGTTALIDLPLTPRGVAKHDS